MIIWRIEVHILKECTKIANWSYRFLHLKPQLLNLILLRLQLTVKKYEVTKSLGEVFETCLHICWEYLLMVSVQFKTTNNCLLSYVKHGYDKCTLWSLHGLESVANVLIFVSALLAQEDIRQWLLDILEVENNAITLRKHQINQVPLWVDNVLLEWTSKVLALTHVLRVVQVIVPAVIHECIVTLNLVNYLLLMCDLRIRVYMIIKTKHACCLILDAFMESTYENTWLLGCSTCIEDVARLTATWLENAGLDGYDYFIDMASKWVVSHISTNVFDVKFLECLILDVAKNFAKCIWKTTIKATFLLKAWQKNLIQLDKQILVVFLTWGHASSQLHIHVFL